MIKKSTKKHDTGNAIKNFNKILDDRLTETDKEHQEVKQEYKTKKRLNIVVAESYRRLGTKMLNEDKDLLAIHYFNKADRVKACDSYTLLVKCPEHLKTHLVYARYCKQRLCPLCNFKRSNQNKKKLTDLLEWMGTQEDYKYNKYYHLTLTVPNIAVNYDNMEPALKMLDAMYKAFYEMQTKDALFKPYLVKQKNPECNLRKKKTCKLECDCKKDGLCNISNIKNEKPCIGGTIKSFECTLKFSWKRKRWEIHPHFHVILSVNSRFHFRKRYLKPLNNRGWGYLWQNYLDKFIDVNEYKRRLIFASVGGRSLHPDEVEQKLSEPLQCDIQAVYNKKAKQEDYLKLTKEAFEKEQDLEEHLKNATHINIDKLKAINKEIKSLTGAKWKYETVKEAIKAWEKDYWNPLGGVKEVAKYAQKDSDVVKLSKDGKVKKTDTDRAVYVFDTILSGRRLLSLTGVFKKAQDYLKIKISDELEDEKEDEDDCKMIFRDKEFICEETEAVMNFVLHKFHMKAQIYQERLEGEDLTYIAERVVDYYFKNEEKKKSDGSRKTKPSDH